MLDGMDYPEVRFLILKEEKVSLSAKNKPMLDLVEATISVDVSINYYDGLIDDVRLYHAALTAAQAAALYFVLALNGCILMTNCNC
jgi:hypothetical protein